MDNGAVISAATIINHEFAHAAGYDSDPSSFKKRIGQKLNGWDNEEEKRVIQGAEESTARSLGEINKHQVTRTNHHVFKWHHTDPKPNTNNPNLNLLPPTERPKKSIAPIIKELYDKNGFN